MKKIFIKFIFFFFLLLPLKIIVAQNLSVPEDSSSLNGYIVPNEDHFVNFNSPLKGKSGALIGVGTFRVFHDAGQGDFSHVICLDYSKDVVDFNKSLITLFQISKDRHDFLSNLVGKPSLRNIFIDFEAGKISVQKFTEIINGVMPLEYSSSPDLSKWINQKNSKKLLSFIEYYDIARS